MAGYDDPRYLRQVIEKLQADVKKLQKSTLPLLSYQRGPTPGWMNAAQIGPGAGMKSAMHIHLDGNQIGVAPRISITDGSGVVRFEAGNLAANGVSAAQYGWRVSDGNNVPIADAIGLSQVMKQLGRGDNSSAQNFTTTTPTVYSGITTTFSVVRAIRVLVLCQMAAFDSTQTGEADIFLDGVNTTTPGNNTSGSMQWGINGPTTTSMTFYSATLSAGSHTFDLRGFVNSTPATLSGLGSSIVVYSLGT